MKQIATNTYEKLLYKYISLKVIKKKLLAFRRGLNKFSKLVDSVSETAISTASIPR